MTTLVFVFKKMEKEDKRKYDNFYSSSKAEIIKNESDIDDVFQSVYTTIITNIQKILGKGSGWIIDSIIDHTISISKYNPLPGRSYQKSTKELDHPTKGSIDVKNIDDSEHCKCCLVRYLNSGDHNPKRIAKTDKDFVKRLDFKNIKFPVKIRDLQKTEKDNSISIDSCMIVHYIMEENILVVFVYMLSLQEKYKSTILKVALKLMVSKC